MQNNLLPKESSISNFLPTKAYKRRWYILMVFVYYSCVNGIQMTEYSSITDVVAKYYNVSHFMVNWTSLLYMILYPILMMPASFIIEKKGLRVASLFGCLGTTVGTLIKLFSIGQNRFWIVMIGQFFTASSQVFIMCLPPKIAAVWFKSSEISIACSLGALGPNLGNAFGYLLTVSIVNNSEDFIVVGYNLKILCWSLAAMIIPITIAVICYFPEKPLLPPSISQSKVRKDTHKQKRFSLFKSVDFSFGFLVHLLAYAINIGVLSTVIIHLSEFVNAYFQNAMEDAGRMGFCMMIFGLFGTVLFGFYLDKTHKFKESCIFIYVVSTMSIMLLTVALEKHSMKCAYIICSIFGIFINPYIPVGFEYGIELTYPSDESTVAGLLFASSQLMSVVIAVSVAHINIYFGPFYGLTSLSAMFTIGTLLQACVPNSLKRQRIFKNERHQIES